MKTKKIDGVLYKLVPEERKKSCSGCAFYGPDRSVCTILTDDCNKGLIYKKVDKSISNSRLKPFNLEAAKAGKPVYTRDGRKARIICFDRKFYYDGYNYPIVAMVNDNDNELVHAYTQDGLLVENGECELDLMMLPEKKEGWAVIRKGDIYETEELARKELLDSRTAMMIRKISWEE